MTSVAKRKEIDPAFGVRLRELRDAFGLTQTELAERAELTYHEVSKYERGRREPTFSTLLKLAAALGVGLDRFQPSSADPTPPPDPEPAPRAMGKRK